MFFKIKIIFPSMIVFILGLLIGSVQAGQISGKVVGVTDGDTVKVFDGTRQYKIRLYGIDTPERRQAFGQRAKQHLSSLIFGNQVTVETWGNDRYGRVIGTIYHDGDNINQEMIKAGFAWVYRKYCKADFCPRWLKMEETARSNKMGLWKDKNPIPPWEFRH